jgi:aldehyde dehydrogenase (NAD+)
MMNVHLCKMNGPIVPRLQQMEAYYLSGATQSYRFRREQLEKLKEALYRYEKRILQALNNDLKKNPEESWVTEIGVILSEISHTLKNLKDWMKPRKQGTNLLNLPSKSYILPEPLGTVLIIGPWNYPLQLVLTPMIGAIAAGNCIVLKPSEFAMATSAVINDIVQEIFDERYITVVQGEGSEVIPEMMNNFRFDHVFYTGSTTVGRIIYEMAAKKLVPVTLELGGKSPCIVEADADLKIAARRIAVTKFSNAGQMCIAPDYVMVHESVREKFIRELIISINAFYNSEPVRDYHYGRIVNEKQFQRLISYMQDGTVIYGGSSDAASLFIEPTLISNVALDSKLMRDEIFGPILPILSWTDEKEVYTTITGNKNPLALYVFTSSDAKAEKWIRSIPFGGGCINNASWHFTNHNLPFGGRGFSGMGNYHGRFSFETFSHQKAIMKTPTWFDPSIKYPPFKGKLGLFKRFIK